MRIPEPLRDAIEQEAAKIDAGAYAASSVRLTSEYKSGDYARPIMESPQLRATYLLTRLPATFAANVRVFQELQRRHSGAEIKSVLDLGAGPGTSAWAAAEIFHTIQHLVMVERDSELIDIGRRLAYASPTEAIRRARWIAQDLASDFGDFGKHDVVMLSYALGEFSTSAVEHLIRVAWASTSRYLAIIEPGTPRNFEKVLAARELLIRSGAHVVAPCPHAFQCPLAAAGDWCHFSQRLERTSEHRRIKGASLGYEDEKFSYFVAAKFPCTLPDSRIVRHPLKHKGHVQMTLCTPQGIERITVTKSRENYKAARAAEWGDTWQRDRVPDTRR